MKPQTNGAVVTDQSAIDGLTVFVVSNEVTVSADPDVLPEYADLVTIHPAATTRANTEDQGIGHGTGLTITKFNEITSA